MRTSEVNGAHPVLQILEKARDIIKNPSNWTQEEMARDANGVEVDSHSEDAVCFCSLGAIDKVSREIFSDGLIAKEILEKFMYDDIADYNDNHTHEEVLGAFDQAIVHMQELE